MSNPTHDWRSISALNTVSTLSQIAQFGIPYVVMPVWLAQHGLNAARLGFFASMLWTGQLLGLLMAPWLGRHIGARRVVIAGLLATFLSLLLIPNGGPAIRLLAGGLAGLGLGLRWIGLEPWLYHLAPSDSRGRIIGFHETLIALAPIIAPLLASWVGLTGMRPFALGLLFCLLSLFPPVHRQGSTG